MWKTNELGRASFQRGALRLEVDSRGGDFGIHWKDPRKSSVDTFASAKLQSVGDDVLPSIEDQFVRGDEWHVHLPQQTGSYSLDIVFRPVLQKPAPGDSNPLVLEATLAIHTSLLDSHPTIDLCVDTGFTSRGLTRFDEDGDGLVARDESRLAPAGSSSVMRSAAVTRGHAGCVLLGRHDYPFTTDHSRESRICLRLFGEFLEKGVIRKARPWIVLGEMSETQIAELWATFTDTPLPLTA